ncbi:MAG: hypothetical protein IRZ28_07845 [Steroidobacteraceae bacterium]|nr:hypothetical protein [Steroidobacteraceae bacterium]
MEACRRKYNEDRPKKSLDKLTPAQHAVGHEGLYNPGKLQNRALLKAGDVHLHVRRLRTCLLVRA